MQVLTNAGIPVSMQQIGALIGLDHTTIHTLIAFLDELGAVRRELLPDTGVGQRKSVYSIAPAVRMAVARQA